MSVIRDSRTTRKSLSLQTILARIIVAIFLIAIFFAVFVLPWLFTGGGR